jgi:hypothetical protein
MEEITAREKRSGEKDRGKREEGILYVGVGVDGENKAKLMRITRGPRPRTRRRKEGMISYQTSIRRYSRRRGYKIEKISIIVVGCIIRETC